MIKMLVTDEELAARRKAFRPPKPKALRGYGVMYAAHVTQANEGCDFDFMMGDAPTPEPEIF